MRGIPVQKEEIQNIKRLRETGHSFPEIQAIVGRGYGTIHRYTSQVQVLPEYQSLLREKQGGSKIRSQKMWSKAKEQVEQAPFSFDKESLLITMTSLYWGEGCKKDLSLINSDPDLVRIFVSGLLALGVEKADLTITLRLYEDISEFKARIFWAKMLEIDEKAISAVYFLKGKKSGKLTHGMCRVRVKKGGYYLKLIMSTIERIKTAW